MSFQEVWVLSIVNRELGASLVAQWKKRSPAVQETQEMQVGSLGREDPLEEENGHQLQYSCLENPTDRAAWPATVHGVPELDITE